MKESWCSSQPGESRVPEIFGPPSNGPRTLAANSPLRSRFGFHSFAHSERPSPDLFIQCHLCQQQICSLGRRERGIHPRRSCLAFQTHRRGQKTQENQAHIDRARVHLPKVIAEPLFRSAELQLCAIPRNCATQSWSSALRHEALLAKNIFANRREAFQPSPAI